MKTKTVRIYMQVPETQDPAELRAVMVKRLGWPEAESEERRKTSERVRLESSLLSQVAKTIEDVITRLDQLEARAVALATKEDLAAETVEREHSAANLNRSIEHVKDDLQEVRTQWLDISKH